MRTIGMLLGIPEQDQEAIRERIDEGLRLEEGGAARRRRPAHGCRPRRASVFAEYIDWRAKNPSDDLMTDLLNAEFEDADGERKTLTRDEVLGYVSLDRRPPATRPPPASSAGPARCSPSTPTSARSSSTDRSLVPGAIEELLRFEAPSPVQARYVTEDVEHHGETVPAGSAMLLINGSATATTGSSPTATPSTSTARSTTTCPSATASTSASAPRSRGSRAGSPSTRCSSASPTWEVDWDNAKQARTSTVRGWETLPGHVTAARRPALAAAP